MIRLCRSHVRGDGEGDGKRWVNGWDLRRKHLLHFGLGGMK